jgi:hypothetical protein
MYRAFLASTLYLIILIVLDAQILFYGCAFCSKFWYFSARGKEFGKELSASPEVA